MKTREYILTNATEFFNREGFTTTSLRQLADYLDMSDGNLRYHFRTKEDLVLAIYQQMLQDVDEVMQGLQIHNALIVMDEARKQMQLIFYIMYQYRFIFVESPLLFHQYVRFKEVHQQLFYKRQNYFLQSLQACFDHGLLLGTYDQEVAETAFEQVFIISDNWIKYLPMQEKGTLDQKVSHYINLCLSILAPLLKQ